MDYASAAIDRLRGRPGRRWQDEAVSPSILRPLALQSAVLAAVLVLAGCGGSSSGDPVAASSERGATSSTTAATTEAASPAETTGAPPATTTGDEPATIDVVVRGGAPVGGIQRASVPKGATVELVVHSDVADEIHLHGYDLTQDVAAGGVARITFVASVAGRFEAELEQRGVQILEVTVTQ